MTWDTKNQFETTKTSQELPATSQDHISDNKMNSEPSHRLSQFWSSLTRSSSESITAEPVVILGHTYREGDRDREGDSEVQKQVKKRYWMSYRSGFEPIKKHEDGPSPLSFVQSMIFNKNVGNTFANIHSLVDNDNFTTDVGWGCMIRTSQSVLANAIDRAGYEVDVELFADTSSAAFSLHNFVKVASDSPLRVRPGQWFGPSAASLSIKRLCEARNSSTNVPLSVLVCESGDIYDDQIQTFPVLLLLPLRLGIDHVNNVYHSSLLQLLEVPQSAGIAGGKPSSSLYFFGYQGTSLLYLDPHYPQNVSAGVGSYHSSSYQKLDISDMDPSMMAGIVLKNNEDYTDLKRRTTGNKIIHFHEARNYNDYVEVEREDFIDLGQNNRSATAGAEADFDSESSMVIVD
ncbi:hypothetical protein PGUG_01658 [Meyerozyma guilliermondii ATCC 6260]|uniref:Probable cysteine protease ATG4 n=1 Tax=Meyerozyma guilliermondii (strain ATCC 6260 / CBS 566 / DSM 6381 / JCM 1539 / NBRC 10279 / NRRL Y-324) TaxID=294746 RepID=ATG4_PICGU|nr:uncharacterized protein PGUG_01658 [Meyerozyma guilliermondii ATCC 6260]A5DEF7.2 RecName: Full=Probable cysteine protease ATG4; AltName: Full=Autophagy-related protein 4 [Meyerozyma guilliermondii ATCC 6260]EDK37561.2 hypothetical protein PGUG_01658 [Meyerozyma guilliermondii ATCC 6260]